MNRSFRLGTTSFIHRAGWLENATRLAPRMDDVEILCFDGDPAALPSTEEVAALAELRARTGLTYSLHAPLEASLASEDEGRRRDGVARVLGAVERTRPLAPDAIVVHVYLGDREGEPLRRDVASFRRRAARSLSALVSAGVAPGALCVESLDYDFELISPVVEELGLSAALDVGHLLRDGRPLGPLLARHLHRARVVHLHGVAPGGRDHRSLRHVPRATARWLLDTLRAVDYQGVLTIEVFGEAELAESLAVLEELEPEGGWRSRR
ncbi:cobamide remodeling phosphodiesterase CbiR [Anaeromyxobacter oryzisoli]|uniref:cobamide remodeling phosphodiesterase CbiR n=1 Tax=Anaeromyxobacter oryzisoli TaxID=2925408 RepID=UPI001F5789FB|nr:cobamide remodeling phosphodiesterase CbiR [Anaeromyxobacter sp. SG63]